MKLDSTQRDLLVECAKSTRLCAEKLFPKRFTRAFSAYHQQVFDLLDAPPKKCPRKLIIAHRSFGKSTLIQIAFVARHILFNLSKHIIQVSCSNKFAVRFSDDIRAELVTNPDITSLWGPIGSDDDFSKEFWVAKVGQNSETAYLPRGTGQQVRGANYRGNRPDLVILDDAEDPLTINNPVVRDDTHYWVTTDLAGLFDINFPGHTVVLGTPFHEDCELIRLEKSGDWECLRIPLCDSSYRTLHESIPQSVVDEKLKVARDGNVLDGFAREYMLEIISRERAIFKQEYFKYYEDVDFRHTKRAKTIVIVDAAKTSSRTADDTAIVGLGIDCINEKIYVRDVIADRLNADQVIEQAIDMADRIGAEALAVEETGLNAWIVYPFKNELLRRHSKLEFIPLKATGRKEDRISWLAPYYRTGNIFHNKACTAKLEAQLLMFPRSQNDDVMDALAHGVKLLEDSGQYLVFDDELYEDDAEQEELEFAEINEDDYADTPLVEGFV